MASEANREKFEQRLRRLGRRWFVPRCFKPYDALEATLPMEPPYRRRRYESGKMRLNAEGTVGWWPYRNGPFDASKYRLVADGWDHEHCCVCNADIDAGDLYWASVRRPVIELCQACHARLEGIHAANRPAQQEPRAMIDSDLIWVTLQIIVGQRSREFRGQILQKDLQEILQTGKTSLPFLKMVNTYEVIWEDGDEPEAFKYGGQHPCYASATGESYFRAENIACIDILKDSTEYDRAT
jgi:hypothetical protein